MRTSQLRQAVKSKYIITYSLMFLLGVSACQPHHNTRPLPSASPANIILLIGDGMDDHQLTIARNYHAGPDGQLTMDTLPQRSAVKVLTLDEQAPHSPVFVADSANSATAIATGVVTSRGRIATRAGTDTDIPTIIELAEQVGLHTGLVTTASVTDATPAAFIAHIRSRFCQSPTTLQGRSAWGKYPSCLHDSKVQGGRGSIAEQLSDSTIDVLLGGGLKYFQETTNTEKDRATQTIVHRAQQNGYQILSNKHQLTDINPQQKLLGLFSPSTLPVKLIGDNARQGGAETIEEALAINDNDVSQQPRPFRCIANPAFEASPSLKTLTDTALAHLARHNPRGFFLMIESASIDKQSHLRRPCGHIGETLQLDQALDSALHFAQNHPNTLILMTADHGQAAQLIPDVSLFADAAQPVFSPGHNARVITPRGQIIRVNYATNNYLLEEHTGVQVPLMVGGSGLANIEIPSTLAQPQLFDLMVRFLDLKNEN